MRLRRGLRDWKRALRRQLLSRFTNSAKVDGVRLDLREMSLSMKDLILRGLYEKEERMLCGDHLTQDDSVLELGAAIGYVGLFCQLRLGVRRYASVEANPDTFRKLLRNYALNGIEPVAWNCALADREGYIDLYLADDFWSTSSMAISQESFVGSTISVPATTTGRLVGEAGFPVSAMIIDIEGAEAQLRLHEFPATLRKVIIELHPQIIGQTAVAKLNAQFAELGFECAERIGNVCVLLRSA